jgi:hypothetical protein
VPHLICLDRICADVNFASLHLMTETSLNWLTEMGSANGNPLRFFVRRLDLCFTGNDNYRQLQLS